MRSNLNLIKLPNGLIKHTTTRVNPCLRTVVAVAAAAYCRYLSTFSQFVAYLRYHCSHTEKTTWCVSYFSILMPAFGALNRPMRLLRRMQCFGRSGSIFWTGLNAHLLHWTRASRRAARLHISSILIGPSIACASCWASLHLSMFHSRLIDNKERKFLCAIIILRSLCR